MLGVVAILVSKEGKTVGARLTDGKSIKDIPTQKIKEYKDLKIRNAIVDANGFVRAKRGSLTRVIKKERLSAVENSEINKVKELLKQGTIKIYHGNKDKDMVPTYGCGDKRNDYGRGFYTTHIEELGKEWAWSSYTSGSVGYLHTYEIELEGLRILNLTELDSLHWVAELVSHRTLNLDGKEVLRDRVEIFKEKYKLDTSKYDIIIGYRADDAYFTYAEDFLSGLIYKETMENALRYGGLGIQIFIKSRRAFGRIKVTKEPEVVTEKYKTRHVKRRTKADREYLRAKQEQRIARDKRTITDFL